MEVLRWNSQSGCGTVVRKLPLKVREWTCQWGAVHGTTTPQRTSWPLDKGTG